MEDPPKQVTMPDPRTKGVVGLQNMGNTCYANSTIQLLRAVPEWNAFVLREDLSAALVAKEEEGLPTGMAATDPPLSLLV